MARRAITTVPTHSKPCKHCGVDKPLTEYHSAGGKYLASWCKTCKSEDSRSRYLAMPNRQSIRATNGFKVCVACDKFVPVTEFHKNPGTRDGLVSRCKSCMKDYRKRYRKTNPQKRLDSSRRCHWRRQGIDPNFTPDTYRAMLASQGERCALCGTTKPGGRGSWHVDHNHETRKVRGLLCRRCNTNLGVYEILEQNPRLESYLKQGLLDAQSSS